MSHPNSHRVLKALDELERPFACWRHHAIVGPPLDLPPLPRRQRDAAENQEEMISGETHRIATGRNRRCVLRADLGWDSGRRSRTLQRAS